MGKKWDLSDFECGMVVGARGAGLSISKTADLLGFSHTTMVMVWGIFSWHTLCPLVPIEHRLNTTAYLSIVADHVLPFMTTVYPSYDGYFQQDNAPCHEAQIISDWFLEHDNESLEREIHIMGEQPTNLQQLRDALMSIWTKISEECCKSLASCAYCLSQI